MSRTKALIRKPLQNAADMDYLDKLSPEERAWLEKFSAEYYGGSFDADPAKRLDKRPEAKTEASARLRRARRDIYHQNPPVSIDEDKNKGGQK